MEFGLVNDFGFDFGFGLNNVCQPRYCTTIPSTNNWSREQKSGEKKASGQKAMGKRLRKHKINGQMPGEQKASGQKA